MNIKETKKSIIQAGQIAVNELIKVAEEKIITNTEDDVSADRLKNAAATKKLAIFDAFEILARIQEEQNLIDGKSPEEKKDLDERNKKAAAIKRQERAVKGLGSTSQIIDDGGDFYDVIRNYSLATEENLMASQLEYNEGKLDGIAKGQFEQKAIDKISDDMFSVVDNTENSQIYKDYGTEYSFLINQLNSQGKEIKTLQDLSLIHISEPTRPY